jgi:hypothetical protein
LEKGDKKRVVVFLEGVVFGKCRLLVGRSHVGEHQAVPFERRVGSLGNRLA